MNEKTATQKLKINLSAMYTLINTTIKKYCGHAVLDSSDSQTIMDAIKCIDSLDKNNNILQTGLAVQKDLIKKYENELDELKKKIKLYNSVINIQKTKITKEDIDVILSKTVIVVEKYSSKTTVLKATLPNGFVIVESSSCVDPNNFDMKMGEKICMENLEKKIWELEGYKLQSLLGLKD